MSSARLEDKAKKSVPKPDCLQKDPSTYTEEDLQTIDLYEKKLQDLEKHRREYKSTLETEIKQIRGSFIFLKQKWKYNLLFR